MFSDNEIQELLKKYNGLPSEHKELLQKMKSEHPSFQVIPKFAVEKLKSGISIKQRYCKPDKTSLDNLNTSNKEDVFLWLVKYLDYETLIYVGW